MMRSPFVRPMLGALIALAGISACASGDTPAPPSGAGPLRLATSVARWAAPAHPDRRPSWSSPGLAKAKGPLLFVSDSGTASVYIYSLSTLQLLSTITGLDQPQGECSNTHGDVWITDTNAAEVYEVTHHGQLENELAVPDGYPVGCAWDKKTGTLAVMELFNGSGGQGAILLYKGGSGSPVSITNPEQYYYNFGGYDPRGNLFVDGRAANGTFMLSELPKGQKTAYTLAVSGGTIYFPGMVQWDPSTANLVVGDQSCANTYASCVYALKLGGSTATITGSTTFLNYSGGGVCDLVQGVIFNNRIAGSDNDFCGSTASATYTWSYPAGGKASAYNNSTDVTPVGAAISQ
ncbi:MAG: hypothetical protein WA428_04790 [Candidatus Cybelea sp.]